MLLTGNTQKEFWKWRESKEILERYKQSSRIDLWENNNLTDIHLTIVRDKKFNSSKYRVEFLAKSEIEQTAIIVDFLLNHCNIVADAMPILDRIDNEPVDLFKETFQKVIYDKVSWLGNGWIMPAKEGNIDFVKDDENNMFDTKEEAFNFIITKINQYLNDNIYKNG